MADYTKLSRLVDGSMKIEKVWGYSFKKWDDENKKMLMSDTPKEGYRKVWQVDTDKGKLDLGMGQMGTLHEAVSKDGRSDLNGVTFEVKSNGKTGMDIRYFFNPVRQADGVDEIPPEEEEVIDLDSMGF